MNVLKLHSCSRCVENLSRHVTHEAEGCWPASDDIATTRSKYLKSLGHHITGVMQSASF